jgi:hypothetical protein
VSKWQLVQVKLAFMWHAAQASRSPWTWWCWPVSLAAGWQVSQRASTPFGSSTDVTSPASWCRCCAVWQAVQVMPLRVWASCQERSFGSFMSLKKATSPFWRVWQSRQTWGACTAVPLEKSWQSAQLGSNGTGTGVPSARLPELWWQRPHSSCSPGIPVRFSNPPLSLW